MSRNRKVILNVPVDTYSSEELMNKIKSELDSSSVKTIFSVNPEKIIKAQENHNLFLALKESDYLIPDGVGTTIGIRIIYGDKIQRTTGILLMQSLLSLSEKRRLKIFIFGSRDPINKMALENILEKYPQLNIVGAQHGYVDEDEYEDLIKQINSLETDILFVGLGSPKQEEWIHKYKKNLKVKICLGIGGSLDVMAGRIRRAPKSVQRFGLEWLYRLIKEPTRLKRQMYLARYVISLLKYRICQQFRIGN